MSYKPGQKLASNENRNPFNPMSPAALFPAALQPNPDDSQKA